MEQGLAGPAAWLQSCRKAVLFVPQIQHLIPGAGIAMGCRAAQGAAHPWHKACPCWQGTGLCSQTELCCFSGCVSLPQSTWVSAFLVAVLCSFVRFVT